MVNSDTIKLLKECNSGVKMGVSAIEEILPSVSDREFKMLLKSSLDKNKNLEERTLKALKKLGDEGKAPHIMAKSMAWMKTNMKLAMEASDAVAADLLTDGCNMGVKSINRYMNKYKNAEENAKKIARDIVDTEENLAQSIRKYL